MTFEEEQEYRSLVDKGQGLYLSLKKAGYDHSGAYITAKNAYGLRKETQNDKESP